jgi:DNA-binding transcriptional regulator YiaG
MSQCYLIHVLVDMRIDLRNKNDKKSNKNYRAQQIKHLRLRCQASQTVFAAYLNTSASTVQKWAQGQKQPSGSSLKLREWHGRVPPLAPIARR